MEELVVLVDEAGTPVGFHEKATVHSAKTPLHLAFSCHVFNAAGQILVTRRALDKLTWPGVWTNSFCGHPAPDEKITDALHRRASHELGISVTDVIEALPDFRYQAVDAGGVVENEICPVFIARTCDSITPNASEVAEYYWADTLELLAAVTSTPWAFSPWLSLQLPELAARGYLSA